MCTDASIPNAARNSKLAGSHQRNQKNREIISQNNVNNQNGSAINRHFTLFHNLISTTMAPVMRRSTRIASIKEDVVITADKPIVKDKIEITKVSKVEKPTKKPKATKVESKVAKKVEKAIKNPLTPVKTSKSRAAKKEDAVVLDNDDEDEEDEDEEDEELQVGDSLPEDLKVTLQNSSEIDLLEYAKKHHILVIFAYPRASTPGCTRQAKGFRDEFEELTKLDATVLGLSADSAKAQATFKTKQELPYDLVCDTEKKLISLLGCKKYPTGIIRSHFVFVDGILKFKNVKISPEESFTKALKEVKGLQ